MKRTILYLSVLVLTCGLAGPAKALIIGTFSWSGLPIVGERAGFSPAGSAVFDVSGNMLRITLTNSSPDQILAIGEALSGLTWDTTLDITLTKVSAMIALGSGLEGFGAIAAMDLSSEWAFKDDISAGSSPLGPLGSFGIGAVGDINFGEVPPATGDTFGAGDRFDTSTNLFGPASPNGIGGSIVGPDVDFDADGFPTQGPLVQNVIGGGQMVFLFTISGGTLGVGGITNVQPMFGTDGAPLVIPEPTTVILLGLGMLGLGVISHRRHRCKRSA